MDPTVWEMVKIVRESTNESRMDDAANTLLGFLPTLDRSSIETVMWEMTKIMRDSSNATRRRVAQKVLIICKNSQFMP